MSSKRILHFERYLRIITDKTGYDFSGYSVEPLTLRLENFISKECIASSDELSDRLESESISYDQVLGSLIVNYTEMFRDTAFFHALRTTVLPFLSTHPKINIWYAGCSTGEEVYSLAILLDEMHLLNRCQILATDVNPVKIRKASQGIYSLQRVKEANARYFRSGGNKHLSAHYMTYYDHVIFDKKFRDQINFKHQTAIDENAGQQFHLIVCRNVFIYFNRDLQSKVIETLSENLFNYGYLSAAISNDVCETQGSGLSIIDEGNKIYRKVV